MRKSSVVSSSAISKSPPEPAWRRRKEHRRSEIVAAAIRGIERDGPENFSIAEIARSAGVSEATVYHYFGTRNGVICAALASGLLGVFAQLEQDVSIQLGCFARLRCFFLSILQNIVEHPQVYRANALPTRWSAEYRDTLAPVMGKFNDLLLQIFANGIEHDELRPDMNRDIACHMVIGSLTVVSRATVESTDPDPVSPEDLAHELARQLFAGISI